MLILFAVLFGGILTGRLLRRRPLRALGSVITFIIWLLLFMLGTEVGGNEEVMRSLATLGVQALVLCTGALAGSIACAWLLWRSIGGGRAVSADEGGDADEAPVSAWTALKGSLVIVAFFAAGAIFGVAGWIPATAASSPVSTYMLYGLMFSVGVSLGHDATLVERIRSLDRRMALLPLCTVVGTLAGAALASPLLHTVPPADAMAVGAGFGYYSLSSIFISELRSVELGTVALLCNVLRELFTLLAAPWVAGRFGPLAAISSGGATTFDTTLPILTRVAGPQYAVVAIFHGCVTDFSVPFLVTFFCSI